MSLEAARPSRGRKQACSPGLDQRIRQQDLRNLRKAGGWDIPLPQKNGESGLVEEQWAAYISIFGGWQPSQKIFLTAEDLAWGADLDGRKSGGWQLQFKSQAVSILDRHLLG